MKVAVIGAGYAGLAAAVELAAQGIPVTVFEAARQLGGRARRVDYRSMALDNGQHIFLGAYRETLRLMRMTGADPAALLLRLPLQLVIPGHFRLQAAPLPAPLHLAFSLLMARGLTWGERISAVRFMSAMRRRNFRLGGHGRDAAPDDETCHTRPPLPNPLPQAGYPHLNPLPQTGEEANEKGACFDLGANESLREFYINDDISAGKMLTMHGQTGNLRRHLWEPLCIAALNTPLETASAQVFLNVLRDSLAGSRADSDMLLPLVDLTHLFPEHAAAFLMSHGGKIVHSRTVLAVKAEAAGFSLEMRPGSEKFDQVICAVPPQRLADLTANLPELAEARAQVGRFSYQPIYSIFLQYPAATRLPRPMIGLYGGITQWVFDRGQLNHEAGLLCAVISAEGPHQTLDHDELARRVNDELRAIHPSLPQPLWHKVIAEKRATFACSPSLERPGQVTPLPNFYLAGDYTAGDYPATLESAVRSGVKCAQLILESP